jgi:hypothetical protein
MVQAIEGAEAVIVSSIERECEALRAGQMLAAEALRVRLRDSAKLYVNLIRAARASIWTIEQVVPGTADYLDARRNAFAALLRVELAVLAAERAAAEPPPEMPAHAASNVTPLRRVRKRRRRAG